MAKLSSLSDSAFAEGMGHNRRARCSGSGKRLKGCAPIGPVAGKITTMSLYDGYAIETTLDPPVQPFLRDHQIDGTPLLPGVMGIEAFAEAALCLLPGWYVEAVEDVNFLAPFKFHY